MRKSLFQDLVRVAQTFCRTLDYVKSTLVTIVEILKNFNIEKFLRKNFQFVEMGWKEIGETFTRFTLLKTPWFVIHVHKMIAKIKHEQCHDHPWNFWAIVLRGGYYEHTESGVSWRGPGSILYRPASFAHNTVTKDTSWSIIIRSKKVREWGFLNCE